MKTKDQILARKWACDERTIRRWRKDAAPLNDPKRMRAWLAGRKNLPPGTLAILEQARANEAVESVANGKKLPQGAAAALKRMEEMEARAASALDLAMETGDPITIKAARENYLKLSDALRKFDAAVAQSRRDNGELIQRAQVEEMIRLFGWALRPALQGFIDCSPLVVGLKDPNDVASILSRAVDNLPLTAAAAFRLAQNPPPAWMARAMTEAFNPGHVEERLDEHQVKLGEAIRLVIAAFGAEDRERFDKLAAAWKRWREATDPAERSRIWHEELNAI